MPDKAQFIEINFCRFKALESFTLKLRHFNILVGPNNAGKSTILTAFRILAAGYRKAATRKPEVVPGPTGQTFGYSVDLRTISVAEENIFFNYDDSEPASVTFKLSNQNQLKLFFPEKGVCFLIADSKSKAVRSPSAFVEAFPCPIGFVPILGPVDQNEALYEKEAARHALFNYRAARNFRNIWHHYPEKFNEFRATLKQTWPGMDIEPPKIQFGLDKARLHMFCPEDRIPREICWAGFGFQVWCQMLTHIVQSSDKSLFLVDEPDIYLHSDLQRQLLGLLRNLGPDILIATHSTEIISEAEADDIVLINKRSKSGKRIKHPGQLAEVFSLLGSNLNPILTQLAKTRRVVFVEGKDFQILGKFARKLNAQSVSNRAEFAVVPVEGFNPERIRSLKNGMETTLGGPIAAAAILDRDYRSDKERSEITARCKDFCSVVVVHQSKEIENFLLVPSAIDKAAELRVKDRAQRSGKTLSYSHDARSDLEEFMDQKKSYVVAQTLAARRIFERSGHSTAHESKIHEEALNELENAWKSFENRVQLVPGKEAVCHMNQKLQERYGVSITPTGIIDAMSISEIPSEVKSLITELNQFSRQ